MDKYYLLDLERSFQSGGQMYFWKANCHGYTTDFLEEAGLFSKDQAEKIVAEDIDQRTIKVNKKVVDGIFKE